jgi:hypothetical protein
MTKARKKPSPLARVWNAFSGVSDLLAVSQRRLVKIETRLATLDGGPDADEAAREALDEVSTARRKAGLRAPALDVVEGGRLKLRAPS